MSTVGLRELRQDASALLRRVEAGEEITITVAGGPRARLVAVRPVEWRGWDEVADVFRGPGDLDWERDRDLVDGDVGDPWVARWQNPPPR